LDWEFANKDLRKLYETGKSRKYRGLPPEVLEHFFARIQQLEAAEDIYDLWETPSLNFEKLKGKRKGTCSIRVDGKWRLEFEVDWEDTEETRGFCRITKLSCHYGD